MRRGGLVMGIKIPAKPVTFSTGKPGQDCGPVPLHPPALLTTEFAGSTEHARFIIPQKEGEAWCEALSGNQIIFGGNYFAPMLTRGTKGWVVWDKGQHGLSQSDCELAYSSFDCATRVVVINRAALQQDGNTIHPTQKPVRLYRWILQNYARPGDRILDTHAGSGADRQGERPFRNQGGEKLERQGLQRANKGMLRRRDLYHDHGAFPRLR